jgi:hypothetical protein
MPDKPADMTGVLCSTEKDWKLVLGADKRKQQESESMNW